VWLAGAGRWLVVGAGDSLTSVDPGARGAPTARRGDCLTDAGTPFAEVDAVDGCRQEPRAAGDVDLGPTLFATGRFVYGSDFTTGATGFGLAWWRRSATGRLTFAGCLGEEGERGAGCTAGSGAVQDPSLFAVARSGRLLVVGRTTAQGLAVLRRDPRSGAVRLPAGRAACVTPTGTTGDPFNPSLGAPRPSRCLADRHVADASGMALDRTGRRLYVAAGERVLAFGVRG
jgi:hypothetical protein